MSVAASAARRSEAPFRHEALLYAGEQEFLAGTLPFIRAALAEEEPILVAVDSRKIELLREALGRAALRVRFEDMARLGANPARIIPAWREFVAEHAARGRGLRGIGEPISPDRSAAELVECHRHESPLNLAFHETTGFWLLCPYDTEALDPAVVEEAQETHPFVRGAGASRASDDYGGLGRAAAPFAEPLPEPPTGSHELAFEADTLEAVRRFVSQRATEAGIEGERMHDLVLAVNELTTNSVRHAGGHGALRIWQEADALVCEVRDGGRIDDPLVGRERPRPGQTGGAGLWLANQLCELVELRSFPTGTVVRLHMRVAGIPARSMSSGPIGRG